MFNLTGNHKNEKLNVMFYTSRKELTLFVVPENTQKFSVQILQQQHKMLSFGLEI